jgi:hypothetical protein
LIRDLWDDGEQDARRDTILLSGGRILRRKRRWRIATRCLAILTAMAAAGLCIQQTIVPGPPAFTAIPDAPATLTPASGVHYLSDDELLALFPETPVGLATVDGKKWLIFPRPGDEARFVMRL